jgi:hypothetical protein
MHALELFSILWLAAVAAFTALMIARAHLTTHEIPELFLDDNADQSFRKRLHDDVVRRVNTIHPYCKNAAGLTAALTVLMVGTAVAQALPYVHF